MSKYKVTHEFVLDVYFKTLKRKVSINKTYEASSELDAYLQAEDDAIDRLYDELLVGDAEIDVSYSEKSLTENDDELYQCVERIESD